MFTNGICLDGSEGIESDVESNECDPDAFLDYLI